MAEPHSSGEEEPHGYHAKPIDDGDWSSDSDTGATAAGYSLLQNESTDEEDYAAEYDSYEPEASSSAAPVPLPSDEPPWMPFKTISTEEEARLRLEAFAQFDRNYEAEVVHANNSSGRPKQGPVDITGISSAMSSFAMNYQPSWSGFEGIDTDDLIRDMLTKSNVEWKRDGQ